MRAFTSNVRPSDIIFDIDQRWPLPGIHIKCDWQLLYSLGETWNEIGLWRANCLRIVHTFIVDSSYSILVNKIGNNNRTWTQASPHMFWHVDSNCGILVNTSLDHYHRNRSLLWFVLPWKPPSGPTTLNVIDLFSIKIPIFELSLHPMVLRLYQ